MNILKIIIGILFVLIVASLIFALVSLVKDRGRSKRTVNALTLRVILSVLVFLCLLIGYFSGALLPHNIVP